jgi:hypothetical protein
VRGCDLAQRLVDLVPAHSRIGGLGPAGFRLSLLLLPRGGGLGLGAPGLLLRMLETLACLVLRLPYSGGRRGAPFSLRLSCAPGFVFLLSPAEARRLLFLPAMPSGFLLPPLPSGFFRLPCRLRFGLSSCSSLGLPTCRFVSRPLCLSFAGLALCRFRRRSAPRVFLSPLLLFHPSPLLFPPPLVISSPFLAPSLLLDLLSSRLCVRRRLETRSTCLQAGGLARYPLFEGISSEDVGVPLSPVVAIIVILLVRAR